MLHLCWLQNMQPQPWHVPVNRCHMLLLNAPEARGQTFGTLLELPQKSQMPAWLYLPADTTKAAQVWPPPQHVHVCLPNFTHCILLLRIHLGPTQIPRGKGVWEIQTSQSLARNRVCYKGVGTELRKEICCICHIIVLILQRFISLS